MGGGEEWVLDKLDATELATSLFLPFEEQFLMSAIQDTERKQLILHHGHITIATFERIRFMEQLMVQGLEPVVAGGDSILENEGSAQEKPKKKTKKKTRGKTKKKRKSRKTFDEDWEEEGEGEGGVIGETQVEVAVEVVPAWTITFDKFSTLFHEVAERILRFQTCRPRFAAPVDDAEAVKTKREKKREKRREKKREKISKKFEEEEGSDEGGKGGGGRGGGEEAEAAKEEGEENEEGGASGDGGCASDAGSDTEEVLTFPAIGRVPMDASSGERTLSNSSGSSRHDRDEAEAVDAFPALRGASRTTPAVATDPCTAEGADAGVVVAEGVSTLVETALPAPTEEELRAHKKTVRSIRTTFVKLLWWLQGLRRDAILQALQIAFAAGADAQRAALAGAHTLSREIALTVQDRTRYILRKIDDMYLLLAIRAARDVASKAAYHAAQIVYQQCSQSAAMVAIVKAEESREYAAVVAKRAAAAAKRAVRDVAIWVVNAARVATGNALGLAAHAAIGAAVHAKRTSYPAYKRVRKILAKLAAEAAQNCAWSASWYAAFRAKVAGEQLAALKERIRIELARLARVAENKRKREAVIAREIAFRAKTRCVYIAQQAVKFVEELVEVAQREVRELEWDCLLSQRRLEPGGDEKLTVFIRSIEGGRNNKVLGVVPCLKVNELKWWVHMDTGICPTLQQLRCNGVKLPGEDENGEETVLKDFHIRNQDTIMMSRTCMTTADPTQDFDISTVFSPEALRELESDVIDFGGETHSPLKGMHLPELFADEKPAMHVYELDDGEQLWDEKKHHHKHKW
jgi:hypothetical protein